MQGRSRFPVTVTQLPVTRCQICGRTLAYRPGNISEVLTEHCRRAHPDVLGIPAGVTVKAQRGRVSTLTPASWRRACCWR